MKKELLKTKNYCWIIILAIFFIAMLLLHQQIELYGDDFWYAYYTKGSFIDCIIETAKLYLTTNGRLIPNILNSVILYFDMNLWRLLNCIMICLLIVSIIGITKSFKNIAFSLLVTIFLFLNIDVLILQESTLWLTGSFNYIYPLTLILINFYFLKEYADEQGYFYKNKKLSWILVLTTFLSAFLVEQTSVGSGILIFGLMMYKYFVKKEKISNILFLCFLSTILAFLMIFFSPGCMSRIDNEQTLGGVMLIISNIKLLLNLLFFYKPFQLVNILLTIGTSYYIFKYAKNNKYLNLLVIASSLPTTIFSYIFLRTIQYGWFDISSTSRFFQVVALLAIVIYIVNIIVYCIIELFDKNNEIPSLFIMMGYGVQFLMIVSPTMGYRTTLITYIAYVILILFITNFIIDQIRKNNFNSKSVLLMISIILVFISSFNYLNLYKNYKLNSDVLRKNDIILSEYQNDNYNGIIKITLNKTPLINYRWMMPYESEPHLVFYREYYCMPKSVELVFE